jgi:rod shape-determining protein MreB
MALFRSPDLAIDLGTATTRVAGGRGGVRLTPSSAHNVPALHRGVIVNVGAATELLRPMMRRRRRAALARLRVLACAPTDVSPLERNSVQECILKAGASSVIVIPEPLAAAVGSGIDIGCKYAKFLVDFGDGVTDCAVIRGGQIVASLAERVGCGDLRQSTQSFLQRSAVLEIAEAEAERVLRLVGLRMGGEVLCRGSVDGEAVEFQVSIEALHAELRPLIERMLAPIKELLRELPAPVAVEIIEEGIFLTGGGALLPGLGELVSGENGIDTRIVADPLGAVIRGAWTMLPFAATLNLWKVWGRHQRSTNAVAPASFHAGQNSAWGETHPGCRI